MIAVYGSKGVSLDWLVSASDLQRSLVASRLIRLSAELRHAAYEMSAAGQAARELASKLAVLTSAANRAGALSEMWSNPRHPLYKQRVALMGGAGNG